MIANLVLYFAVGRIAIFLIQKFPLTEKISKKSEFLDKLFKCDLCLGVWVYWALALVFNLHIESFWYVPVFSELLFGACSSFIMHLISMGWKSEFQNIIIE